MSDMIKRAEAQVWATEQRLKWHRDNCSKTKGHCRIRNELNREVKAAKRILKGAEMELAAMRGQIVNLSAAMLGKGGKP